MKSKFHRGLMLGFLGALLASPPALAQIVMPAEEIAALTKTLPIPSQTVLARLDTLSQLPAGEWRLHAGDMAHGEDPDLKDASWQSVQPGPDSHAGTGSVWYRRWIEVPKNFNGYDLTGARIWFLFKAGANGPTTQIVYFNGRRVAMGEELEPIILFDKAKPGDKVLVAIKLPHTVDLKTFAGVDMKIDFAPARPSPEDLRVQFLSAAALLPSLSKTAAADMATLNKAIAMVDLGALDAAKLDAANQARFHASLRAADAALAPLKPVLRQATVFETGNSHIDAAWLWPVTETIDSVKRTWGTALQLMEEYPWYTFTQSAAAYNEWMATKYPALNDDIKARIKQGRWEIVGGMWVEPDLNMPDGESLARSLLIGKRYFQKEYGVDVRIGWNPDSFGYNWQLPQIYKKSGVDYFVTQKLAWNDTNELPFKLFWWQSPDGSKVLSYFPHGYDNHELGNIRTSIDLARARRFSPGLTEMMDLYGVGDHGGGATRFTLDQGAHWKDGGKLVPTMQYGTASTYFARIEKQIAPQSPVWDYDSLGKGYTPPPQPPAGQIAIPTMKSELYFEYHRGVFTTQAQHKRSMRESEEWTLNAEKYASLAWLDGNAYPGDQLTGDWKKVTFNDFHDLAAGSGIGLIYKEAQKEFDEVRLSTDAIKEKSLAVIAAHIDTAGTGGVPVLIFNPLAWTRSGLVEVDVQLPAASDGVTVLDAQNHVLPSQVISADARTSSYRLLVEAKSVPSMGYQIVHAVAGRQPFASDLKTDGLSLENAALRVTIDKATGCITSLFDKASNFETLAQGGCGNELQAFKDLPKQFDAWNIDPGTLDAPPALLHMVDSVQLIEKGPLRSVVRVTRSWRKSKFVQDIQLYAGADQVNIVNDIDWHEDHILLKAAFPLSSTSAKATYEIPYGSIQRSTAHNNSWEKAQFEVPALRWADLGDDKHGLSLINESKYGYDARGNVLRLSLLRSPTWPDPVADRGHQHFSFALRPHAGDWKQALTVRHGYEYNYALTAMQVAQHAGQLPPSHSFVTVEPENVVLTAMKKAEDGNALMLHMYEWAGKASQVDVAMPAGATSATVTNLMEKAQGPALAVAGGHVRVPIKPYEIVAVRFDYPRAQ